MTHALSNIIDLTNAPTPPRWFEFVFEPDKLEQHLEKSPVELITSFFRNMPDSDTAVASQVCSNLSNGTAQSNGTPVDNPEMNELCDVVIPPTSYEAKYRLKKSYALQILAIKVASHLKWNLDVLCDGLTIPIQCKLLQALKNACQSDRCPAEVRKFASVIYCRWFLRSAIAYKLSTLQPRTNSTTIIYLSQLQQQQQTADSLAFNSMGELFSEKSSELKACLDDLYTYIRDLTSNIDDSNRKTKTSDHPFKKAKLSRPKVNCYDSRDEQINNWEECEPIEPLEFMEAACYDLGRFLFFEESYPKAKEIFDMIKTSKDKFPLLEGYLQSTNDILGTNENVTRMETEQSGRDDLSTIHCDSTTNRIRQDRDRTEKYLFDCMSRFSQMSAEKASAQAENEPVDDLEEDSDLRIEFHGVNHQRLPENSAWYSQIQVDHHQQQLLEMGRGDIFMSRGNFKQAMGCFVGALMLMTDYFSVFSKNYADEEPYITRMIQCSISLSCFTQAVALCQMTKNLNYTMAFKQLNERICNDCCDDIYECIWNVTLLEYIINLHSRRGEVERRTKVIQLIGQLELNENNPEEILKEAEHVRRGRFFRIMSNKYL